ncbi:transcriptional regulator [Priestia megaterium]|uniref:Transcriptional regulator n=1 Tax=Priestia megaterium TaxID=1404 RepID=A0A3D8WZN5_PRIMG|nr:helix-turn-helix transcriptional regulator [Priestia megaterium]MDH3168960.1 helix-turn-helix transcriptional regulator [Priestia megaterium]RDZ12649.1 transcriptional regulator [Priestia megaterium]
MVEQWFGLGKRRSKFGKWLDRHGVSQSVLADRTKLSTSTISHLSTNKDRVPNLKTASKIIKELRRLDPNIKSEDFWDI